ncbi:hypothetical protein N7532_010730 [Penicillium argentinense]|uniref:Uncharacterized protein n=1 Tax=Penicillium argentinense TaxID=1131581 RepID=A0A9W9EQJ0_9EURO|nr:uncharacterized protein N7532_010730 [Penicillium argentinense]KAJ5085959.1 hypothetical protein N7532_010730 [Penicillium argentinense]
MGNKISAINGVKSSDFYAPGNAVNEIWIDKHELVSRLPFGDSDLGQASWPLHDWPKIPWHQFIIPLKRDLESVQCPSMASNTTAYFEYEGVNYTITPPLPNIYLFQETANHRILNIFVVTIGIAALEASFFCWYLFLYDIKELYRRIESSRSLPLGLVDPDLLPQNVTKWPWRLVKESSMPWCVISGIVCGLSSIVLATIELNLLPVCLVFFFSQLILVCCSTLIGSIYLARSVSRAAARKESDEVDIATEIATATTFIRCAQRLLESIDISVLVERLSVPEVDSQQTERKA